jgi:hypothetical protein
MTTPSKIKFQGPEHAEQGSGKLMMSCLNSLDNLEQRSSSTRPVE